jgi:hypothetical protein
MRLNPMCIRDLLFNKIVGLLFFVQVGILVIDLTAPFHGLQIGLAEQEAVFLNGFTDHLFAPGYDGAWDPLASLLLLPVAYYAISVILSATGQTIYKSVNSRYP